MKQFRLVDNLLGWLAFAVAAFTYCSTIEPTASFWDCPEFITTGYKLEVGHPPGAPFFMLTANFFSQFTSDPMQVAKMVNIMSALFSAACILFLFWSISHLARKLICSNGKVENLAQLITIEASAMVGALAYCFSDTFWFSAVEGEVYAYSSLFTAVVFWLMLKWEDNADDPRSDRWLILIAYLTGLSVGVHLLNLLCVPALVLVYYFRKAKKVTFIGAVLSLVGSFVILAAVLYGIVPGIVKVGGWFELLFVNAMGCSFNTGLIVYIILLFACVIWAIWESTVQRNRIRMGASFVLSFALLGIPFYGYGILSYLLGFFLSTLVAVLLFVRKRNTEFLVSARWMNTTLLCMLMIMIGYSSYTVIVIRSSANPPMDQNSPEDVFTLGTYLNREQYGDRPLFYGQAYTSHRKYQEGYYDKDGLYVQEPDSSIEAPIFVKKEKDSIDEKDSYTQLDGKGSPMYKITAVYEENMLFPRMYSQAERHPEFYEFWNGGVEKTKNGLPTMWENLKFFQTYQCNFMYWRYFMWNFAGRQNDIQCIWGEPDHGNWLSGIPFIDNARLGDQDALPDELRENKGHNVYYCLPLILGLIGLIWQVCRTNGGGKDAEKEPEGNAHNRIHYMLGLSRGAKNVGFQQFWVVLLLFFMTGLAIVLYLNQTPLQPRERDYAYAGSFYAFAIWIGLGVAALADGAYCLLRKQSNDTVNAVACAFVGILCMGVPILMGVQNWDDHDRSGRYTCRDFGHNYLESLSRTNATGEASCPIIFTNGDNDTFPLWYSQETESFRTDARVCNLSYLQTDWYIDQMKRPAYDSPSLPISWKKREYSANMNDYAAILPDVLDETIKGMKENGLSDADIERLFGGDPYDLRLILDKWVLNHDSTVINFKHALKLTYMQKMAEAERNARTASGETASMYQREANRCYQIASYIEGPVIPTSHFHMKVDKEAVKRSGMMIAGDSIPDYMEIEHLDLDYRGKKKIAMYRSELIMYELLAQCNWERPLYVAISVGASNYGSLGDFFVQEGLAYRITPFNTKNNGKRFDADRTYENYMKRFNFGGIDNPSIYLDETVLRMCYSHRHVGLLLADAMLRRGDREKAREVMEYCDKMIPATTVPYTDLSSAGVWLDLGNTKKAVEVIDARIKYTRAYIEYSLSMDDKLFDKWSNEYLPENFQELSAAHRLLERISPDVAKKVGADIDKLMEQIEERYQKLAEKEAKNKG